MDTSTRPAPPAVPSVRAPPRATPELDPAARGVVRRREGLDESDHIGHAFVIGRGALAPIHHDPAALDPEHDDGRGVVRVAPPGPDRDAVATSVCPILEPIFRPILR